MDLMLKPNEIDLNEYKNNTEIYAIYKRPTSDLGTGTERDRMEKAIPCEQNLKESWSSNTQPRKTKIRKK